VLSGAPFVTGRGSLVDAVQHAVREVTGLTPELSTGGGTPDARFIAGSVRVLLMSLTVVVALEQLQIGRTALLVSFAILFSGIVIAAAIAFGLGGRDLAREWLASRVKAKPEEEKDPLQHL